MKVPVAVHFSRILPFDRNEPGKGAEKRLRFMDKPVNFKRLPRPKPNPHKTGNRGGYLEGRESLMSGKTTQIRNLVLIGHGGCGKTSLAEALLFGAGATSRLGKVDDGSSVLDYEPEEIKRKITISSAFHHYQWKKHTVYLADTPGDDNFLADTRAALHVADAAVVVVDAVDGVKVGTEKVGRRPTSTICPA